MSTPFELCHLLVASSGSERVNAPRLVFLGPDEHDELLEVMAIETDTGGLLIIHAQRIRNRYRELVEGGL